MRVSYIALGLIGWIWVQMTSAHGFVAEEERLFEVDRPAATLNILSTADLSVFAPLVEAFQARNPTVEVHYVTASSSELMKALYEEDAEFDIAISSAMDLQTKLVNDGFAERYVSTETASLPDWAKWRDRLYAFTQEPAVLVYSKIAFEGLPQPTNRDELIALLRENPDRFQGRVGTYDIRESGAGYLFATQDSRQSESLWRMAEVMGRLDARLYCCSSRMIRDVVEGRLALAYNVLGSYAAAHLADNTDLGILQFSDFTTVMLRTVLIPKTAGNLDLAGQFVDFLVSEDNRDLIEDLTGLPAIDPGVLQREAAFRPIRLGPGLLVYLDQLKRRTFIRAWLNAMVQP
ncbi:MAG: ABC transporter substrate-binding protein [Roseibium album]|uniref:ABC-type thiamine transport system, periplasmic component n=2 Tax=cellular organisms TaxID=131567 RepID=A0A0M7AZ90_9HYPH|nr:ABC transporter substrate-binding protein [Roseibium album]MBG6148063.1 iron(III) transport system substrate-binding protein [Labrenzia sp. EL_142]MBG6154606.1 iron(III) transport system substrate-binding protein [Labrenzia sp. EL_162]MBG6161884.1 iron(III) transport system substrate-binding protein [Labrenzia sp. EL_195]MBG6193264.1 iron(III) transport system substrate-binding protein [Labrenzia sp. EL_159]MBG6199630.1 iron(III) transport system substrate-binding protein [Labrenzia sp. EL_